jgi:hypothetical protein
MIKLKLKKNSSLRENGLYDLEKIMGDSDGHGAGFGGEDIAWYINWRKTAKSYKRLEINMRNDREIEISYTRIHDIEKNKDDDVLDFKSLPEPWIRKLQQVIYKHARSVENCPFDVFC